MKRDNRMGSARLPDGKLPQPRRLDLTERSALAVQSFDYAILDLRRDRLAFMDSHLQGVLFAPLATGGGTPPRRRFPKNYWSGSVLDSIHQNLHPSKWPLFLR